MLACGYQMSSVLLDKDGQLNWWKSIQAVGVLMLVLKLKIRMTKFMLQIKKKVYTFVIVETS